MKSSVNGSVVRVKRTITDKAEEYACRLMLARTSLAALRSESIALQKRVADQQVEISNLKARIAMFETAQDDADNVLVSKAFGLPGTFQFHAAPDGSCFVEHDK